MQVNWQSTQITAGQCWRLDVEIVSRQIASKLIGFMAAKPQIGSLRSSTTLLAASLG